MRGICLLNDTKAYAHNLTTGPTLSEPHPHILCAVIGHTLHPKVDARKHVKHGKITIQAQIHTSTHFKWIKSNDREGLFM